MRKIYIFLFLMFCVQILNAQNAIKGKIVGLNNEALIGATIYLPELMKGTSTNIDGTFLLSDLPKGKFLAEFKCMGYSTRVEEIQSSTDTFLVVVLHASITEMQEVVVTGVASSSTRDQNPLPMIFINHKDINQGISTNLMDALKYQAGISQITTGSAISKPIIRGLGYNRVVSLSNGIRQEGQQWGDEHGLEMDENSVENIEIIKGPGSLMYGSDAMGGVVNFLSPKPYETGKIGASFMSNYQTNNHLFANSLVLNGANKRFNYLIRLSQKNAGNYKNALDGVVYNSGFKEINANATVGITRKWGYSQLYLSSFNQRIGMVEGERDSLGNFVRFAAIGDSVFLQSITKDLGLNTYHIDIPQQHISHHRVHSSTYVVLGRNSLSTNLSFQQNNRKEYADLLNPNQAELFFKLNTFNYDFKFNIPIKNAWKLSFGLNGMYQSSQNLGEEFLIPEYHLFDIGAFAFFQKTIKRFSFSGGVRYDIRKLHSSELLLDSLGAQSENGPICKFNDLQKTFSNISSSLGTNYKVNNKLNLKVSLAQGFRAPNMSELSSNGKHEGTFRYELGNSTLQSETSFQLDVGAIYRREHFSLEADVFANTINHFIYLTKLESQLGGDSIVDASEPSPTFKFTQGNAQLYGGEFSIDFHPHPYDFIHLGSSVDYVRAFVLNQSDSMKNLPFTPAPKWHNKLRVDIKEFKFMKNAFVEVEWVHYFAQNNVFSAYGTETPTPAYSVLNAGFGFSLANKKGKTISMVYFAATNLLDVAYQNHLSRLKDAAENPINGKIGVFDMGRNASIKWIVPIGN